MCLVSPIRAPANRVKHPLPASLTHHLAQPPIALGAKWVNGTFMAWPLNVGYQPAPSQVPAPLYLKTREQSPAESDRSLMAIIAARNAHRPAVPNTFARCSMFMLGLIDNNFETRREMVLARRVQTHNC